MSSWQDHLSALQALVGEARSTLAHDDSTGGTAGGTTGGTAGDTAGGAVEDLPTAVAALTPPATRLPAAEAERARELLGELRRLTDELTTAQVRVGRQLHLHRRIAADREGPAGPVYLDSLG